MKNILEVLKKHLGDAVGVTQGSTRCLSILIPKEKIEKVIPVITKILQMRLVFLFAADERGEKGSFGVYYVFSYEKEDHFLVVETRVEEKAPSFLSVTPLLPQANWFEREIHDLFGLTPEGHPDPRPLVLHEDWPKGHFPLRKDFKLKNVPRTKGDYFFDRVEGEGVFEIPVGPVHAGIIEPGHFRFSSAGESILKLEIRHFYTHKGTEKLGEGKNPLHLLCLAERISGDHSLAHAAACVQALEALSGTEVPMRAQFLRTVFLELERLHNHLSDIAGISLDVAFSFGASQLMRLKERLLQLNERLTGTRLLRSVLVPGGVKKNLEGSQIKFVLEEIKKIKDDFQETIKIFLQVNSFLDRIEFTGVIKKEIAEVLGAVGPTARASGLDRDLRRDHPYAAYSQLSFIVPVFTDGDVEGRMKVKIQEVYESCKLIYEALTTMPPGAVQGGVKEMPSSQNAFGYVESPRGECFHWISTDRKGRISRWKIHSPSFVNWPLIQYAVLENIVPDFPLINKSLNLSYSGNDR